MRLIFIGFAVTELVAGVLVVADKKLFEAYALLTFILLVAVLSVWLPAGLKDMSGSK